MYTESDRGRPDKDTKQIIETIEENQIIPTALLDLFILVSYAVCCLNIHFLSFPIFFITSGVAFAERKR
jgi:hypothetical protein